jgi:pyridoxal phosphate enzyme (YggS family)
MIADNVKRILEEIPEGVTLEAAAKSRTAREIDEAIRAGIEVIGENYVNETLKVKKDVLEEADWHFIGHLQRNKVKKAVEIFDLIETVDSVRLAREIDKRCSNIDKLMPVFIEVNSGREPQKYGVLPEDVRPLIEEIAGLEHVEVFGLMTMGPFTGDPEDARPYFVETRRVFGEISGLSIPGVRMKMLSMGMSNSYKVAIEEGANLVRIGTKIFGEREY